MNKDGLLGGFEGCSLESLSGQYCSQINIKKSINVNDDVGGL